MPCCTAYLTEFVWLLMAGHRLSYIYILNETHMVPTNKKIWDLLALCKYLETLSIPDNSKVH